MSTSETTKTIVSTISRSESFGPAGLTWIGVAIGCISFHFRRAERASDAVSEAPSLARSAR